MVHHSCWPKCINELDAYNKMAKLKLLHNKNKCYNIIMKIGLRVSREAKKSCWSVKEMKMSKGLKFSTWSRLRLWINKTTIYILVKSFSTFMKSFGQTIMDQCSLQNFLDGCEYIHGSSRCNGNIISAEKILLRSSK